MKKGFLIGFLSLLCIGLAKTAEAIEPLTAHETITRLAERLQQSADQRLESLQVRASNPLKNLSAKGDLSFSVDLPNGDKYSAKLQLTDTDPNGVSTFKGRAGNTAIRVNRNKRFAITTVRTDDARWKVISIADSSLVYNAHEIPRRIVADDVLKPPKAAQAQTEFNYQVESPAANNSVMTYDLMMAYTQATIDFYESEQLVLTRLADIIDTTNEIYEDSNAQLRVNLAESVLVDYDPENTKTSSESLQELNIANETLGVTHQMALMQEGAQLYVSPLRLALNPPKHDKLSVTRQRLQNLHCC